MASQTREWESKIASAAIDLGTTFSGWAFSFRYDYLKDPLKIQTRHWLHNGHSYGKTATCILIRNDGMTLEAFGFEAAERYADLLEEGRQGEFFFFKLFKMSLYTKHDCLSLRLHDVSGRTLPAVTVFSLAIGYLKDDLLTTCSQQLDQDLIADYIMWVLTLPAIWTDENKRFMRAAGTKAGIHTDDLRIALEPEVASICCRLVPVKVSATKRPDDTDSVTTFSAHDQFLVVDAGGGTVDITVYEVGDNDKLSELRGASGGPWGGANVDRAFQNFLTSIVTKDVMKKLETEFRDDFDELMHSFELNKARVGRDDTQSLQIRLPTTLNDCFEEITGQKLGSAIDQIADVTIKRGRLVIGHELCKNFFSETVECILKHLKKMFKKENLCGVPTILLVGGFSESPFLQNEIRRVFPEKRTIIPPEPSTAVMKGAVIFGHENHDIVQARKSKFTYGIGLNIYGNVEKYPESRIAVDEDGNKCVVGIFHKLVGIGETCSATIPTPAIPLSTKSTSKEMFIEVYASEDANPQFVDDESCFKLGELLVDCRDEIGNARHVEVRLYFGGPEIMISAVHTRTGVETRARFSTEYSTVL